MSAMSDDPRLVTPTIAPSTLLPKGFPWVTPDKQESLELDHEDAAGPASLPPPPRRIPSREDTRAVTVAADTPKASPNGKSITAGKKQRPISALPEPTKKERPVSALPELSPLPVTPLMPAPRMRDEIHNVRLGAAFDDARNMRLSIASEFSVSTVGSASTKAGSSRARITRTTVKAP
jgi:hypothetical protein